MLNKKALAASLSAKETDADFKQTVLLLHGDGTNGAQNNTFTDSSTNAFSITRNGNTTQGTFSPFSQADGYWGNYFGSDGTGEISAGSDASLAPGTGDFCFECWIYATTAFSNSYSGLYAGPGTSGIFIGQLSTGLFGVRQRGNTDILSQTSPSINKWVHIAVTRSGTSLRMFYDGVQQGSTVTDSTNFASGATSISSSSFAFVGYISNARFVKGSAVYTSAFTPSTTPLTAITNTKLLTCQSNRFIDNSTNAFSLTTGGTTSVQPFSPFAPTDAYSAGTNGGSGYFDGSSDYLSIANDTAIDAGTGVFTYECWFYPTAGKNNFLMAANGTGSGFHLAVYGSTTTNLYVSLGRNNVAEDLTTSAGTVIYNAWNHIVAVRNSSNNLGIFINGTRQAYNSSNTNNYGLGGYALTLGTGENNNSTVWMQGYQAGAGVYKSAEYDPTQTSITVPTAPKTGTGAGFLCNFTNAGIIDQTGKNNLETVGNAQIDTGTKKFGTGSIYFDGTGDNLKIPHSVNQQFGTGDFTFEAWIYPTAITGTTVRTIVAKGDSTTSGTFQLAVRDSKIRMYTDVIPFTSSANVTVNAWQHIALTRSGTTLRFFLDGALDTTVSSFSTNFNETADMFIGSAGASSYFTGYIDDIRITKGVARYTAAFTAPTKAFADQ